MLTEERGLQLFGWTEAIPAPPDGVLIGFRRRSGAIVWDGCVRGGVAYEAMPVAGGMGLEGQN